MRRTDAQSAAVPIKISYFNGRVVLVCAICQKKTAILSNGGLFSMVYSVGSSGWEEMTTMGVSGSAGGSAGVSAGGSSTGS